MSYELGLSTSCEGESPCGASGTLALRGATISSGNTVVTDTIKKILTYGGLGIGVLMLIMLVFRR